MTGPDTPGWFVFAQFGWALCGASLAALEIFTPAMSFLIWFAGFLVAVEITPRERLHSRIDRGLRLLIPVGYLGVVAATYLLFV